MFVANKYIFWTSISFNILGILLACLLLERKGGVNYLINRMNRQERATTINQIVNRRYTYLTSYHKQRKDIFTILPHTKDAIIFLGDSLTDQVEWQELLQNPQVKNRGISGDTTDGVLARLEEILQEKPGKIFLAIGTNDIWNERKSLAEIMINYRAIVEKIQLDSPKTQLFIQSILPVNNQNFKLRIDNKNINLLNQEIEKLAREYSVEYINIHKSFLDSDNQLSLTYTTDGVHLNGQGYLIWKQNIATYVKK